MNSVLLQKALFTNKIGKNISANVHIPVHYFPIPQDIFCFLKTKLALRSINAYTTRRLLFFRFHSL